MNTAKFEGVTFRGRSPMDSIIDDLVRGIANYVENFDQPIYRHGEVSFEETLRKLANNIRSTLVHNLDGHR